MATPLTEEIKRRVLDILRTEQPTTLEELIEVLNLLCKQPSSARDTTYSLDDLINALARLKLDHIQNNNINMAARYQLKEDYEEKIASLALQSGLSVDELKNMVLRETQRVLFGPPRQT